MNLQLVMSSLLQQAVRLCTINTSKTQHIRMWKSLVHCKTCEGCSDLHSVCATTQTLAPRPSPRAPSLMSIDSSPYWMVRDCIAGEHTRQLCTGSADSPDSICQRRSDRVGHMSTQIQVATKAVCVGQTLWCWLLAPPRAGTASATIQP